MRCMKERKQHFFINPSRAEALSTLAPHLPPELMGEALAVARTSQDESSRAEALSALAPYLPAELKQYVFWQSVLDGLGLKAAELETAELEQQDGTAYEVGKYTLKGDGARCSSWM